jgi:polyisoprenoid-binding protein YceI
MSTVAAVEFASRLDPTASPIATGAWRPDPTRSSVEFHVRHFYGLVTVKGQFAGYAGTLKLGAEPAVELTIEADTLDTKQAKRDKHLRSADFFAVERHPEVRFVSESATLDGETLRVRGQLRAAGKEIPVALAATVRAVGEEFEVEAVTQVDHRDLGMTWSPLGILRAPSTLVVRGHLIREEGV